jgi:hypothetical protein
MLLSISRDSFWRGGEGRWAQNTPVPSLSNIKMCYSLPPSKTEVRSVLYSISRDGNGKEGKGGSQHLVMKRRNLYCDGSMESRTVPPALAGAAQLRATPPVPPAGKKLWTKKNVSTHITHCGPRHYLRSSMGLLMINRSRSHDTHLLIYLRSSYIMICLGESLLHVLIICDSPVHTRYKPST